MGDFNDKVGRGEMGDTVGKFGFGTRNEWGNRTVLPREKCNHNKYLI